MPRRFCESGKSRLDYYEIYLGKQLLLKRYVNQPLNLQTLSLNGASTNDQLVIHYYQCNAPGKVGAKRSLSLRDETGKTIKQWHYADGQGGNTGMAIPGKRVIAMGEAKQWQAGKPFLYRRRQERRRNVGLFIRRQQSSFFHLS